MNLTFPDTLHNCLIPLSVIVLHLLIKGCLRYLYDHLLRFFLRTALPNKWFEVDAFLICLKLLYNRKNIGFSLFVCVFLQFSLTLLLTFNICFEFC